MPRELGGFFGDIIIIFYVLTVSNYFVKFIYKKYRSELMKNAQLFKVYTKLMKLIIKNHKLFGGLTIIFILLHFFIQYNHFGLNITGVIAAGVMFMQVGLGIYGSKAKIKSKKWLMVHRIIALMLLITIGIHVA